MGGISLRNTGSYQIHWVTFCLTCILFQMPFVFKVMCWCMRQRLMTKSWRGELATCFTLATLVTIMWVFWAATFSATAALSLTMKAVVSFACLCCRIVLARSPRGWLSKVRPRREARIGWNAEGDQK